MVDYSSGGLCNHFALLPHSVQLGISTLLEILQSSSLQVGPRSGSIIEVWPPSHPPSHPATHRLIISLNIRLTTNLMGILMVSAKFLDALQVHSALKVHLASISHFALNGALQYVISSSKYSNYNISALHCILKLHYTPSHCISSPGI